MPVDLVSLYFVSFWNEAVAIPWDVILIIMSVIAAIAAMQLAGGLDYMVQVAKRFEGEIRKYINHLAPPLPTF